ncbi:trypsin-like serine peptidase [Pseudotabrizicola algicola]|uniref:trypsin-like serine peptidase n=1 Tax=Pseudotabrizicola algicola TaxID=2709381 RepID=UPI003F499635
MRALAFALFGLVLTGAAEAQDMGLRSLQTGDDSRGWEAVGRINLGDRGFCTGALIAEDLVLTAAHCLFDKTSGVSINASDMQFLAGWRNGRAVAYRGVRQALAHPEYVYGGRESADRVPFDLALLQLDQPIRLTSVRPYATDARPQTGDEVGVVSYAQDRAEAPSLQQVCRVLGRQSVLRAGVVVKPGGTLFDTLVLSCDVDFGSSGAPVFSFRDGTLRIVSVISAKAEVDGEKVSLGTPLADHVEFLRGKLAASGSSLRPGNVRVLSGGSGGKFVQP